MNYTYSCMHACMLGIGTNVHWAKYYFATHTRNGRLCRFIIINPLMHLAGDMVPLNNDLDLANNLKGDENVRLVLPCVPILGDYMRVHPILGDCKRVHETINIYLLLNL